MKMIFVVGASRSGTSMLNMVLGMNSDVKALNELHYFGDLWSHLNKNEQMTTEKLSKNATRLLARHFIGYWGGAPTELHCRIAAEIVDGLEPHQRNNKDLFPAVMEWIAGDSDVEFVSEQTPRNIFFASEILKSYPNANVIQIVRDPRGVLVSQKRRWRRKFMGVKIVPWREVARNWVNYHPITISKLWKKAAKLGIALEAHPRFMQVRYEDIAGNPQEQISSICEFIGLEYHEGMLNVLEQGSSNRLNVKKSVGISADFVEAWRGILTRGEMAYCEKITKIEMEHFGYERLAGNFPLASILLSTLLFPVHAIGVLLINPTRALQQFRSYIGKWIVTIEKYGAIYFLWRTHTIS